MGDSRHEGLYRDEVSARLCSERQSKSFQWSGMRTAFPSEGFKLRSGSCSPSPSQSRQYLHCSAKGFEKNFLCTFFAHLLLPSLPNFCVRPYPLQPGLPHYAVCSCLCATRLQSAPAASSLLPMNALTRRYEEAKEKSTMDYFYALYHLDQARPQHTHARILCSAIHPSATLHAQSQDPPR